MHAVHLCRRSLWGGVRRTCDRRVKYDRCWPAYWVYLPGNAIDLFQVAAYPGVLVKDSYWLWPRRELAGNTIDLFAKVLGLSFNDAMRLITEP